MNGIWVDVVPEETSDSAEYKAKISKTTDALKNYQHQREALSRGYRWKISDDGLDDVKAHARGISNRLIRFLKESEFIVSVDGSL